MNLSALLLWRGTDENLHRGLCGEKLPHSCGVDIESQWSKSQVYSSASLEHLLWGVGEGPHSSYPHGSFPHFLTGTQKPQNFLQHA